MKFNYLIISILFPVCLLLMASCHQENDVVEELKGEIQIDLQSIADSSNGRILENLLDDADAILVTIENADGSSTDYNLTELELYQVDENYISQKISLPIGDYNILEFLVIDSDDNIKYLTPLDGSSQAQNVVEPLPIAFSITLDEITALQIEVISSENLSLEDFGLVGFNLSEIDLFQFLVSISERGNLESLLGAKIILVSGDYQFSKDLQAVTNNSVVIKDGYSFYEMTIEKEGYDPFTYIFSRDSLGYYSSTPLTIELAVTESELTIQERLDNGETPISIFNSGVELDELYGKTYEGGLIFYLDTMDGSGMVSSLVDQSAGIMWHNGVDTTTGASGVSVETGSSNTDIIISVQGADESNYAAGLAREFDGGGFNDWFLPSQDEFVEMWYKLHKNDLGNFSHEGYWTSTETLTNSAVRFTVHSNGSSSRGGTFKSSLNNVRAVRNF